MYYDLTNELQLEGQRAVAGGWPVFRVSVMKERFPRSHHEAKVAVAVVVVVWMVY